MHALTNPSLVMSVAIIWTCFSIVLSAVRHDWTWFSRAGSIITLAGGILAARTLLRLGVAGAETSAIEQPMLDAYASAIAVWFIVLGTLIWGYGDWLGHFLTRTPRKMIT
jgi:hypothetical protein